MQYQFVIQLPEKIEGGFDTLIEMEERLDTELRDAELDGHDIGSGEMNIFIYTNDPNDTFQQVRNIFNIEEIENIKIAYRDIEDTNFICLWPKGLSCFKLI